MENINNDFEKDMKRLEMIPRKEYMKIYRLLGAHMWDKCQIPTVGDFASIIQDKATKRKKAVEKNLNDLTSFTGNADDIEESINKKKLNYTNEESDKFMNKVIASNITDISDSGWFYKKLISSADNMKTAVDADDCGSAGVEYNIDDITEDIYDFKIRFQFINEIDGYIPFGWEEAKGLFAQLKEQGDGYIHVRTPLTCKHSKDHRTICPVCAGITKKSNEPDNLFIPKNIGIYATLMITEHATQASLDSMNNGQSENLNKILDKPIKVAKYSWDDVTNIINGIVDDIGNIGVESRYYEIALMSRFYRQEEQIKVKEVDEKGEEIEKNDILEYFRPASMMFSFKNQKDLLGLFVYQPTSANFLNLISSKEIDATSVKSQIMFDTYE